MTHRTPHATSTTHAPSQHLRLAHKRETPGAQTSKTSAPKTRQLSSTAPPPRPLLFASRLPVNRELSPTQNEFYAILQRTQTTTFVKNRSPFCSFPKNEPKGQNRAAQHYRRVHKGFTTGNCSCTTPHFRLAALVVRKGARLAAVCACYGACCCCCVCAAWLLPAGARRGWHIHGAEKWHIHGAEKEEPKRARTFHVQFSGVPSVPVSFSFSTDQ